MSKKPTNEYVFRIDALTPETLSMERLVRYLEELVTLFGNNEHVHFSAVRSGSALSAIRVDDRAQPKVRQRLTLAHSAEAPLEICNAVMRINRLLREDNASGDIKAPGGAKILEFPGRKEELPDEAIVAESGALEGQIVRLGGKDDTAHAVIEIEPGQFENFTLKRTLAKELALHLYGEPVRVEGKGRWKRSPEGLWSLASFTAERFESLTGPDIETALLKLANLKGNAWREKDDPIAELERIRGAAK